MFTDTTFENQDQLYWKGYSSGESSTWKYYLDNGYYDFLRIPDFNSNYPLFDSDGPHFNDIAQGGAGTCYVLASLGAMAEFPELVTSLFISGQKISKEGIYNIRFYIRGKPWVVTVDYYMLT
jgi:hypothetical protein